MIKSHVLDDFLDYLRASKGSSELTIREYYYDIRAFLRFIRMRKENLTEEFKNINIDPVDVNYLKTVNKQDIYSYLSYLDKVRNNSNRTKYRKLSSVRTFFDYLTNKIDVLESNPAETIDLPKIEKTLPTYFTLEESIHLLQTIKESKQREIYKTRDYAIVTLFLNTGMRLSELYSIDVKDIKKDNSLSIIGKGNKERIIFLNQACIEALNRYLKEREYEGLEDLKPLFLSMRKNRMSKRSIQHMIKKHITNAGFDPDKYSVHKLRHTAATLMYQYGDNDLRTLQEILGHKSVTTTEIYTHIDKQDIKHTMYNNPLSDPTLLNNKLKEENKREK